MSDYDQPLFKGYTADGQFVAIHRVELLHNGRLAVTVTVNRQTLEMDTVADARVIAGMGAALLASAQRQAVA